MARGLHLSPRPNLPQWAWASTHWPCSPSITELWMKKGNLTLHGHYCVLTRLEVQVESDYRMSWMPEWYFEVNFLSSEAASEFGLGCDRWLWHHRKTIWTLCYGTTLSWAPDNSAWPEASSTASPAQCLSVSSDYSLQPNWQRRELVREWLWIIRVYEVLTNRGKKKLPAVKIS